MSLANIVIWVLRNASVNSSGSIRLRHLPVPRRLRERCLVGYSSTRNKHPALRNHHQLPVVVLSLIKKLTLGVYGIRPSIGRQEVFELSDSEPSRRGCGNKIYYLSKIKLIKFGLQCLVPLRLHCLLLQVLPSQGAVIWLFLVSV